MGRDKPRLLLLCCSIRYRFVTRSKKSRSSYKKCHCSCKCHIECSRMKGLSRHLLSVGLLEIDMNYLALLECFFSSISQLLTLFNEKVGTQSADK